MIYVVRCILINRGCFENMKECICVYCGKVFLSKDHKARKTCSKECRANLVSKNQSGINHPLYKNGLSIKKEYKCKICDCLFISDKGYDGREPTFCSKKCYSESLKIERPIIKCKECGVLFTQKYLQRTPDFCSIKCSAKNHGKRMKGKPNGRNGSLCSAWKGGVTKPNEAARKTIIYREWRESVFKRDNYTCVICNKKGGYIQADHILPFSTHIDKRFDINNGRTLCVECHKKTETYGGKMKSYLKK